MRIVQLDAHLLKHLDTDAVCKELEQEYREHRHHGCTAEVSLKSAYRQKPAPIAIAHG